MTCPINLDSFTEDWRLAEAGHSDRVIRDLAEAIEQVERANQRLHDEADGESVKERDRDRLETHRAVLQASALLHGAVEERLEDLSEEIDAETMTCDRDHDPVEVSR